LEKKKKKTCKAKKKRGKNKKQYGRKHKKKNKKQTCDVEKVTVLSPRLLEYC
jgi:hypothetical protein